MAFEQYKPPKLAWTCTRREVRMIGVRWIQAALGVCLLVEGASTGLWITSRIPVLAAYDGFTLAVVAVRGFTGALQLTAGSLLWKRSDAGLALGPVVLVASAILYALELGAGWGPNSVAPSARWRSSPTTTWST